jgi:hypothetical protein
MAIGGKPFSLQAPEDIAKEYGGNKQKIIQAAKMGIVDPTAALMAGMFIDRMRSAQMLEQQAPQTVADEVFAPPAPPMQAAGLGATPPAAAPGANQMGAAPQGAMPPQAAGLEAAPVPEAMFSAGGGIVGYADGGPAIFDPNDGRTTVAEYLQEAGPRWWEAIVEQAKHTRELTPEEEEASRRYREAIFGSTEPAPSPRNPEFEQQMRAALPSTPPVATQPPAQEAPQTPTPAQEAPQTTSTPGRRGFGRAAPARVLNFIDLVERVESGGRDYDSEGRPLASSKGALYAMQVMPATASDPGFGITPARSDTPEEYNRVGREYAAALLNRYDNNQTDALVAYNWGPDNANRWIAEGRPMDMLPRETREYLDRAGIRTGGTSGTSGAGGLGDLMPGAPMTPEDFASLTAPRDVGSPMEFIQANRELFGELLPETAAIGETIQALQDRNAPEEVKKQRSQDLWGALANFGFRWASTGNLAESAQEGLGALQETLSGRKEQQLEDLLRIAELQGVQREQAMAPISLGLQQYMQERGFSQQEAGRMANFLGLMYPVDTATRRAVLEATLEPSDEVESQYTRREINSMVGSARDDIINAGQLARENNDGTYDFSVGGIDPAIQEVLSRYPNALDDTTQMGLASRALAELRMGSGADTTEYTVLGPE